MSAKRQVLGLKTPNADLDIELDQQFEIGVYDVLLPCRSFRVDHKVAELGRLSITTEFLLRLLKQTDVMKEEEIAKFFGFDHREMSFLMSEAEQSDYVVRLNGTVQLTTSGEALFKENPEQPEIVQVESRHEVVGFDLIALAPEARYDPSLFEKQLPEIRPQDLKALSTAAAKIPKAFGRFYGEIMAKKGKSHQNVKKSLYSVDAVEPKGRFLSSVRMSVVSSGTRPGIAEVDLNDWRPEFERDERKAIVEACSVFLDRLKSVRKSTTDREAYNLLTEFEPAFFKSFMRTDGLSTERYFRESLTRAGEFQSNRPTVPILGSLLTRANTKRVLSGIEYGFPKGKERPDCLIWLVPQVPYWNATIALPEFVEQIKRYSLARDDEDGGKVSNSRSIALVSGRPEKYIEKAFDVLATTDRQVFPPSLEIFLIPGIFAAVSVLAPIGAPDAVPIPLGFASFDKEVNRRVREFVENGLSTYANGDNVGLALSAAVDLMSLPGSDPPANNG